MGGRVLKNISHLKRESPVNITIHGEGKYCPQVTSGLRSPLPTLQYSPRRVSTLREADREFVVQDD